MIPFCSVSKSGKIRQTEWWSIQNKLLENWQGWERVRFLLHKRQSPPPGPLRKDVSIVRIDDDIGHLKNSIKKHDIFFEFLSPTKLSRLFRPQTRAFKVSESSAKFHKIRSTMGSMKFVPRFNQDRGHADHGWLKTFHTFSFAAYVFYHLACFGKTMNHFSRYYTEQHSKFGSLRVINEDRVEPNTGFGTHPHKEFEIFSYIVDGALEQ